MAAIYEVENQELLNDWIASRPPIVQDSIKKYPPHLLYMNAHGWRCEIVAYNEDGTVNILIPWEYNQQKNAITNYTREVFSVNPGTLTECDFV